MIIGFDRTFAEINQTGTGIYVGGLAKALSESSLADNIRFFSANQTRDISKPKSLRTRLDTLYRDLIWMHVRIPIVVEREKVNLLHMPSNIAPLAVSCPVVLSILDTTVFQNPQNFPWWQRNYFLRFGPRSARYAAHIITLSEASKRDIIQAFGILPERISAIPIAVSPYFKALQNREEEQIKNQYSLNRFILTVGSIEPRKNLLRLIEAFKCVQEVFPDMKLVHAGPRGWQMDHFISAVDKIGLSGSVRFLGKVPLNHLVQLYNAAEFLVYPSLYEGFGLPILEAMSCGCPVITSNVSSMPEVASGASLLINPLKTESITDAMLELLRKPSLVTELREKGLERAKAFSWTRCAEETIRVYEMVSGK